MHRHTYKYVNIRRLWELKPSTVLKGSDPTINIQANGIKIWLTLKLSVNLCLWYYLRGWWSRSGRPGDCPTNDLTEIP